MSNEKLAAPNAEPILLPKVVATSVVRGSQQGQSHGGVFLVDFESQIARQVIDWNRGDIDWEGRGADRGLRGIAIDGDHTWIAASDELFCYDREFQQQDSYKNRYLKHAHEMSLKGRTLFISSTGHDAILAFDLDSRVFTWGFHLQRRAGLWEGFPFDPRSDSGPRRVNDHHINNVFVDDSGIFVSGLRTGALLNIRHDNSIAAVCSLPQGIHNARPFQGGVLFNDTADNHLRCVSRDGSQKAFAIKQFDPEELTHTDLDDSRIARQGFGRGLCVQHNRLAIGGSSPSTLSVYDLATGVAVGAVNLTVDVRNAIHGLAVWPHNID